MKTINHVPLLIGLAEPGKTPKLPSGWRARFSHSWALAISPDGKRHWLCADGSVIPRRRVSWLRWLFMLVTFRGHRLNVGEETCNFEEAFRPCSNPSTPSTN
jgi:hypothetical protein